MKQTKTLGLALGGGGMKGLAHVGALSVIEAHGLKPDLIAGTSIGAIVGALYAAGLRAADIKALMQEVNFTRLMGARFDGKGLLKVDKLEAFMQQHLAAETFEDLSIPLKVVCTDLEADETVIFDQGPLVPAVLASAAIPGVFAPVKIEGRLLVDGGLCNNLPVSVLVEAGMTHTIGIRLFRQMAHWRLDDQRAEPVEDTSDKQVWYRPSLWGERLTDGLIERLPELFTVVQRALDLVVMASEHRQLDTCRPDVLIEPEVTHVGVLDLHQDKDILFDCGINAAREHTDALKALINHNPPR